MWHLVNYNFLEAKVTPSDCLSSREVKVQTAALVVVGTCEGQFTEQMFPRKGELL